MEVNSKLSKVYEKIFDQKPDKNILESMVEHYKKNNESIESVEEFLRKSKKFTNMSFELEKELEIAELYYNILERMPDKEGLMFYKNQLLGNRSLKSIKEEIENSKEYKEKKMENNG